MRHWCNIRYLEQVHNNVVKELGVFFGLLKILNEFKHDEVEMAMAKLYNVKKWVANIHVDNGRVSALVRVVFCSVYSRLFIARFWVAVMIRLYV